MPTAETLNTPTIAEYLAAATEIAAALDAGADPNDPAVLDALEALVDEFDPVLATGTDGAEILSVAEAIETLAFVNGLGGNDLLVGGVSADVIVGGGGNDALSGAGLADVLFGSDGDDLLDGGRGFDLLDGGAGLDNLSGGAGRDTLDGGTGVDTITGGEGRDTVAFGDQAFESAAIIPGDGIRQAENTPDILTDWTIGEDRFLFDTEVFGVTGNKKVSVGAAEDIRSGANVIVITDTDNDANAATVFNAGAAASLIAGNVDVDGAGFFVYWNSALGINRLVYSENLNDATADIRVLGNINTLSGSEAIAALDDFSGRDFAFL